MGNDIAIRVKNLTKIFKIYYTPGDFLKELITGKAHHKEAKALDDVSFEVKKGEVVGFIGRNGAGKSTLLKILTGTLDKTAGEIEINGRISSILELGTGFHPEYTGRENIFMGGLCLGMSKEEIKAKEQSIIDFSELEEYIDQPFRTYSSGMRARLTFATAISVDPEILIVDEALSVGDAKFSRKCFGKIQKFKDNGSTILFVSHDVNSVTTFCSSAIFLERGRVLGMGKPSEITKQYLKMSFDDRAEAKVCVDNESPTAAMGKNKLSVSFPHDHNKKVSLLEIGIKNTDSSLLESGRKYTVYLRARFNQDIGHGGFGFMIRTRAGVEVFGVDTINSNVEYPAFKTGQEVEFSSEVTMWLANGDFFLTGGITGMYPTHDGLEKTNFDSHWDALSFSVRRLPGINHASLVNLEHNFSCREITA